MHWICFRFSATHNDTAKEFEQQLRPTDERFVTFMDFAMIDHSVVDIKGNYGVIPVQVKELNSMISSLKM
jgi:hypothetical protein